MNEANFFTDDFWQIVFLGNTAGQWFLGLAVFAAAVAALKIFRFFIVAKLKSIAGKTKTELDNIAVDAIGAIHWPFYVFTAFYFSLHFVNVPPAIGRWSFYLFLTAIVYYAIRFSELLVDFGVEAGIARRGDGKNNQSIVRMLGLVARILLWAGAAVMLLSNLGYNVTSLVAGLGIGGIAIALAVQNILGDLFNSLAIYFDKPFKIGDFIIVGEQMGVVKKVGIKTTRIQALQGEEIVISNSDLMGARVQNFGVMQKRRIVFSVGVAYGTPPEKLKKIPEMIKEIISKQEMASADRAHFKAFGDFSLNFEAVYYVETGDYNKYMDTQQAINLGIVEKFAAENIEIAFPTQTVYVKHES